MLMVRTFATMARIGLVVSLIAPAGALAGPEEVLLEVDRAFARMASEVGVREAFAAYMAEDAVTLNPEEQPMLGREAIVAGFEGIPPGYTVSWSPVAADIARSRDLGYTWGRYEATIPTGDGGSIHHHGKYVTIWKKQRDGKWKAVLDGGNANPQPPR